MGKQDLSVKNASAMLCLVDKYMQNLNQAYERIDVHNVEGCMKSINIISKQLTIATDKTMLPYFKGGS